MLCMFSTKEILPAFPSPSRIVSLNSNSVNPSDSVSFAYSGTLSIEEQIGSGVSSNLTIWLINVSTITVIAVSAIS